MIQLSLHDKKWFVLGIAAHREGTHRSGKGHGIGAKGLAPNPESLPTMLLIGSAIYGGKTELERQKGLGTFFVTLRSNTFIRR
jgi:hypothetical protein